ncbi:MAG: hypothetical protein ABIF88_03790 [archaeon]
MGIETRVLQTPFDKAKDTLMNSGHNIISIAEDVELRIQEGKRSDTYIGMNYVREGMIFTPNRKPILVAYSPLLETPALAREAHERHKRFYVDSEAVEKAKEQGYVECQDIETYIPTNRFGEEAILVRAFGGFELDDEKASKQSQTYGDFLKDAGVDYITISAQGGGYMDNNSNGEYFAEQATFRPNLLSSCKFNGIYPIGYMNVKGINRKNGN